MQGSSTCVVVSVVGFVLDDRDFSPTSLVSFLHIDSRDTKAHSHKQHFYGEERRKTIYRETGTVKSGNKCLYSCMGSMYGL